MKYLSVTKTAEKWGIAERTVRNYCANDRIPGAFLTGKTWNIPEDAVRPDRINKHIEDPCNLRDILVEQMRHRKSGGIYEYLQVHLTYESNRIEGRGLSLEQTENVFKTRQISTGTEAVNINDIIETANHFRCIEMVLGASASMIKERTIRQLQAMLKSGTGESARSRTFMGEYKVFSNTVAGQPTAKPEEVQGYMKALLIMFGNREMLTLDDIVDFHVDFERIHPFQEGNGRIGRLIMLQQCLSLGLTPFIIDGDKKPEYYRGIRMWSTDKSILLNLVREEQQRFKAVLDGFNIEYDD